MRLHRLEQSVRIRAVRIDGSLSSTDFVPVVLTDAGGFNGWDELVFKGEESRALFWASSDRLEWAIAAWRKGLAGHEYYDRFKNCCGAGSAGAPIAHCRACSCP